MPVIINEFEMVVDEPEHNDNQQPVSAPAKQTLKPKDMERLVQHFLKRRARLQAD